MTTANLYDLTDTWNAGGTTFTGIKLNVTDTASAAASLLMDLQKDGVSQLKVTKAGAATLTGSLIVGDSSGTNGLVTVGTGATVGIKFGNRGFFGAAADGFWTFTNSVGSLAANLGLEGASHTLAQRNGTNAQALRVYKTWSNATDNEWGGFDWITTAGKLRIGSFFGGTGAARDVGFYYGNTEIFKFQNSAGPETYFVTKTSFANHVYSVPDNTYDIGASGATRARDAHIARALMLGVAGSTTSFLNVGPGTTAKSQINLGSTSVAPTSPVNGDIWFDGTSLSIRIGGATKTVNVT